MGVGESFPFPRSQRSTQSRHKCWNAFSVAVPFHFYRPSLTHIVSSNHRRQEQVRERKTTSECYVSFLPHDFLLILFISRATAVSHVLLLCFFLNVLIHRLNISYWIHIYSLPCSGHSSLSKNTLLAVMRHLGIFYRVSHNTRMVLNGGIREPKWLRQKERKLCQGTRAITSGHKASADRPAWWLLMSRTTMALITMKRSWESMRLAGNTIVESRCRVIVSQQVGV